MIEVREVTTQNELELFVDWPWQLYNGHPYWVPPLRDDMLADLAGANLLFKKGPYVLLLAWQDGVINGRLCVGIEQVLNRAKQRSEGYICLFECVNDPAVAAVLFDYAAFWLKERGMKQIKGPISYNGTDDYRGLLVWGFNRPPAFMNAYNPPYYPYLLIKCGFSKYEDCFSYHFDLNAINQYVCSLQPVLTSLAANQEIYIRTPGAEDADQAMKEIFWLIAQSMPEDWADMVPLSEEEVEHQVRLALLLFQQGDVMVAYDGKNCPVGFLISSNDYNPLIKKLEGKLSRQDLPAKTAAVTVTSMKVLTMFVLPDYQECGASLLLLTKLFEVARQRGYTYAEGATIGETNREMCSLMNSLAGKPSSVYRIYTRDIE